MKTKNKVEKMFSTFKLIIILLIVALIVGIAIFAFSGKINNNVNDDTVVEEEIEEESEFSFYNDLYNEYHTLNSDYVGYLEFKNNLLYDYEEYCEDEYPGLIVRSNIVDEGGSVNDANSEYLKNDITKGYSDIGQEFMDGSNLLDDNNLPIDQNIIIYGHFVYRDHNLKFGPLHKFEDANNYETYDTFTITFNHERRTYLVTDAFFYNVDEYDDDRANSPFATNYTKEELENYMYRVKNEYDNTLDTGITIEYGDNFVTLQTCVEDRDDLLYFVLGKEINRETFE